MSANVFKVAASAVSTAFKNQSSNLLIGAAIVGVGAVAYFAIKETPEVNEKLEKKKEEKGEELSIKEKAVIAVPGYRKTIITCVATVAAIAGAHKCDLNKVALYSSASAIANDRLDKLNSKMEEELGPKKSQKIRDAINEDYIRANPPVEANIINTGKGVSLIVDNLTGVYFYSDISAIERAVDRMDTLIAKNGEATKNEWLSLLGLDMVADGDYTGWNKSNTPFGVD